MNLGIYGIGGVRFRIWEINFGLSNIEGVGIYIIFNA